MYIEYIIEEKVLPGERQFVRNMRNRGGGGLLSP
jgi:hypothetical protein